MTKHEKKRLAAVIQAAEYLFLEHRAENWCWSTAKFPTGENCWIGFSPTRKFWRACV